MKVGTIHTPATLSGEYPFCGQPVDLYTSLMRPDPAGMAHACHTVTELGLPKNHPTFTRPDGKGGTYEAALFPIPTRKPNQTENEK